MEEHTGKREKFISNIFNPLEKIFWDLFFEETDKRTFVTAEFVVSNFGLKITNNDLFKSHSVSLMFTRRNEKETWFVLNKYTYHNTYFNSPEERLMYTLKKPVIANKFYNKLRKINLITDISKKMNNCILISDLIFNKNEKFVDDLINYFFEAIDIFSTY